MDGVLLSSVFEFVKRVTGALAPIYQARSIGYR
jgi:hypothetical protein